MKSFDPEQFRIEVEEHFQFLRAEFAFGPPSFHDAGRECWVTYSKPGVRVTVYHEAGTPCSLSLSDTAKTPEGHRGTFGLHELIQEKERLSSFSSEQRQIHSLHQAVNALSIDLRAVGSEVLLGDFALLHERHQRHRSAIDRNS